MTPEDLTPLASSHVPQQTSAEEDDCKKTVFGDVEKKDKEKKPKMVLTWVQDY